MQNKTGGTGAEKAGGGYTTTQWRQVKEYVGGRHRVQMEGTFTKLARNGNRGRWFLSLDIGNNIIA